MLFSFLQPSDKYTEQFAVLYRLHRKGYTESGFSSWTLHVLRTVCMQSTNAFKAEGEEAVSNDAELKYAIIERRENPLAA